MKRRPSRVLGLKELKKGVPLFGVTLKRKESNDSIIKENDGKGLSLGSFSSSKGSMSSREGDDEYKNEFKKSLSFSKTKVNVVPSSSITRSQNNSNNDKSTILKYWKFFKLGINFHKKRMNKIRKSFLLEDYFIIKKQLSDNQITRKELIRKNKILEDHVLRLKRRPLDDHEELKFTKEIKSLEKEIEKLNINNKEMMAKNNEITMKLLNTENIEIVHLHRTIADQKITIQRLREELRIVKEDEEVI